MKPDWDKLMDAFADSPTALIADVDCTAEGKPLCDANGVRGYPTIKYGDPSALEDYKGGRDFNSLKKFAEENLKPMCSPTNIDLCDAEKKAEIEKFQAMSAADLDAAIEEKTKMMDDAEAAFKEGVNALQDNNNNRDLVFMVPLSTPKSLTISKDHGGAWTPLAARPPIGEGEYIERGKERANVMVAGGRLISLSLGVAEEGSSRLYPFFLPEGRHFHALVHGVASKELSAVVLRDRLLLGE
eukprot:scaffold1377_cov126-Cylindrotheca_fusiformis.AAC.6